MALDDIDEDGAAEDRVELAQQLMDEGRCDSAANVWSSILAETGDYYSGSFNYGYCLFMSGEYRAAIVQFNKTNEYSETSGAYFNTYLSYLRLGDTTNALANVQEALLLEPNDSTYLFQAGRLCYLIDDYALALAFLATYLEQYYDDTYALSLFCYSLYYSDQDEEATECLDLYLSLVPDDVDARKSHAISLNAIGEHKKALEQFQQCARERRGELVHYVGMAEASLGLGDTTEALKSYCIAVALDSTEAVAHNDYGVLLAKIGKPWDALEQYLMAARMDPTDWLYQWNLGNTYLYLGYDEKASEALTKAKFLKEATDPAEGRE